MTTELTAGDKEEQIDALFYDNDKNRELIIRLQNMMESDLSASKKLYRAKLYPQAVFYLEQSVEIGWKAYGLHNCSINDIKRINHNIVNNFNPKNPDFFDNISIACSYAKEIPELKKLIEMLGIDISNISDALSEHAKNTYSEMIKNSKEYDFSDEEMTANISYLNQLSRISKKVDKDIESLEISQDQKKINEYGIYLSLAVREIAKNFIINDELKDKLLVKDDSYDNHIDWDLRVIKYAYTLFCDTMILIIMNIILNPQLEKTRYPIQYTDFDPLTYYTEELPLVKYMPKLFKITEALTKSLKKHMEIKDTESSKTGA